jgi:hypothetical protein
MDLQAYNNTRFQFSQNLSAWAALYDLPHSVFRMQVRKSPSDRTPVLDFLSGGATDAIVYDAASHVMMVVTNAARAARLTSGSYYWDYGFTPPGGDFIRIDGGSINFGDGVTR